MKLVKLFIVLIISLSVGLLAGCNKNDNLSKDDLKTINQLESDNYQCNVKITEQYGPNFHVVSVTEPIEIKWEQINISKAEYWFDSDIDLKNRKLYILNTVNILTELNKRYNIDNTYELFISEKVISHNDNNKIYIKYNKCNFDSEDFIIQVLYNIFEDTSNYGLLYGEMVDIEKSLKIYNEQNLVYNQEYIKKQISNNPDMLDLTLPVFSETYYNSLDIDYIKSLSTEFVSFIKNNYSNGQFIELLELSSEYKLEYDDKFTEYMNEFLLYKKFNIIKEKDTFIYRYKIYNDNDFPICICTEWMKYCFDTTLKSLSPRSNPNNISGSIVFSFIKKTIEHFDKNMSDVRNFWNCDITKEDCKDVITYFSNQEQIEQFDISIGGYCDAVNDCIFIKDRAYFIHEYTHYITLYNKIREPDVIFKEGIAEVCSYKFESYNIDELNKFYMYDTHYNNKTLYIKESFNSYLKSIGITEYNKSVFENIDRRFDFIEIMYYKNLLDLGTEELCQDQAFYPYVYGCSFVKYLIDNYGIDKYMQVFDDYSTYNFMEIYKININKMHNRYIDYLANKYGDFIH
ncbi:hypothetical protein JYG23_04110 [Sedimentibacter sp. zth1]|uniref:hypothetical protein n=1 Tax=Sedimentibacter sp. zth1 TaxID=2816908 RepID=UPI001A91A81A|nr:hypothetical protein [Sedimentibacter sp. zth1]QSX06647.1 hypothetical protein JYG23_04110 [Sedimentibacter sp. zth1]